MIVLKILAAPLCGGAAPAGSCPVHRRPDTGRRGVSCAGISHLSLFDWLMDKLYSLKYSLQDFITG